MDFEMAASEKMAQMLDSQHGSSRCISPLRAREMRINLGREKYLDLTIRKEILWESATATRSELVKKENEFIIALQANNPAVGYNLAPRFMQPPRYI
jgi:hypothetical protein